MKRRYKRKDMNYRRPLNKKNVHKGLAKSSPKKMMGLRLSRMYGRVNK